MTLVGRTLATALVAALIGVAPAAAADYCVGEEAGCLDSLDRALQAARESDGPDRIRLAGGEHEVPPGAADGVGEPVEITGAGPATKLTGALDLTQPLSRVSSLAVDELALAGIGSRLVVSGPVRLAAGARLGDALLGATVTAVAPGRVERSVLAPLEGFALVVDGGDGRFVLENVEISLEDAAAGAFDIRCAGLTARHATVTGTAALVADVACAELDQAMFELRDSVIHGNFADIVRGAGSTSAFSLHPVDDELEATSPIEAEDPGFVSAGDLRPAAGSPLVDAGDRVPLATGEGFWDLGSRSRITDGDADGVVRRDVGAHERQPPPVEVPSGNVLLNPGAESGDWVMSTDPGPEPPAWTRTGSFTQVGYGAATRTPSGADVTLPTREAGAALGGGTAFFSAGRDEAPSRLLQRIDVSASAQEIDTGLASAAIGGLLGGYGADEDEVRVTATFRDPEGVALAALTLGPVTAAERGNATNLLHRTAAGAIPQRTRAIDVEIASVRVGAPGAESYTDAYADNLSLILSVPGVSVPGPVHPETTPPVRNLRPFAGITVLTGRPKLSRTGRTKVRVACASATVGGCTGTLELRAQLRRGQAFSRIAQFARLSVAPGRAAAVTVKLTLAARRALRRARSFRATLRAVVRDGQGLERRTTIPIRVVRAAPTRRR